MDGQELRRRREALRLTQEQLAAKLGATRQAVYLWEKGKPVKHPGMLRLALERLAQDGRERGNDDRER